MADQRMTGAVVVGVVDTAEQRLVVRQAAEEAVRRGAVLRILHAVEWPAPPGSVESAGRGATAEQAEQVIASFSESVAQQFPQLEVLPDVVSGSPARALVDRSSAGALIVVGHRGTGGFPRLPLGSVSLQIATHSACPVLVVRPGDREEPRENRVVVGVDVDDLPSGLMEFALETAEARNAALEVVYVATRPELLGTGPTGPALMDDEAVSSSAQERLENMLASYRSDHPGLDLQGHVKRHHPAEALVDASRHASLLVVGSHGRTGLKRLLLGSVSGKVLHTALCPVAVVPTAHQGRGGD
ncbi:universal stress protein [Streptomyces sp. SM11]|uniref:universal stress protein n=1 Tax=Streptomyces sp. SM11 TaxID=565557 RepID=UPI000CD58E62|nr:universal stress protein [Streptomyces sp. SM11]